MGSRQRGEMRNRSTRLLLSAVVVLAACALIGCGSTTVVVDDGPAVEPAAVVQGDMPAPADDLVPRALFFGHLPRPV